MLDYAIVFASSARRELERLPSRIADRILCRIEKLAKDPRPPRCMKLAGSDEFWRVRVGDYRVVYAIHDDQMIIEIVIVRQRSDAYRGR